MTQNEFNAKADALATQIGVRDSHHGYFTIHRTRLYEMCKQFDLFERELGDVLEIGPFYSYIPVLLRGRARSYHVLEGTDDPALDPLRGLYAKHDIELQILNLVDIFGLAVNVTGRLPHATNSFDTILCWETMEHFNFNPVPFVRELWRITRPGGKVYLSVPNRASGETLFSLLTGRNQRSGIDTYFKIADSEASRKGPYLGFHWREYTLLEFTHLFRQAQFHISDSGWVMHFQDHGPVGLTRKLARALLRCFMLLRPSLGKGCYLVAEKRA